MPFTLQPNRDLHGGDISCGKFVKFQDIMQACENNAKCTGFSQRSYSGGVRKPWCMKRRSGNPTYAGDHDFYVKSK